jgi:chaperonin cofactor prefoldin
LFFTNRDTHLRELGEVHMRLGNVSMEREDFDMALQDFDEALTIFNQVRTQAYVYRVFFFSAICSYCYV